MIGDAIQHFAPRGVGRIEMLGLEPDVYSRSQALPRSARAEDAGGREAPGAIDRALALCERLLGEVEAFALQFDFLGDIELPPQTASQADQASVRAAAALYLASELEEARLLDAVEALAGVFASGGVTVDLGEAEPLLAEFWRGRKERFTAKERRAFFARLFGSARGPALAARGGSNAEFESLMIDLTEAISRLHADPVQASLPATDVRIRSTARRLAENLSMRGGGIAAFAARDLLEAIKTAIKILKQPEAQQAAGARSVWGAVGNIARQYLDEDVEIGARVTRGKAGLEVLSWLAEALPQLDRGYGQLVTSDHPVVAAALNWLQASLDLAEQPNAAAGSVSYQFS